MAKANLWNRLGRRGRVKSPWSDSADMASFVIADALGAAADQAPPTRDVAMSVPSVAKGRNLLVSTVATRPLVLQDAHGNALDTQPAWLGIAGEDVTAYERMAWTVDDGIFYGVSLWEVTRDANGAIETAIYCPYGDWDYDPRTGDILIAGVIQPVTSVILFSWPADGLLHHGARTIRAALDTERAWAGRVRNPIPVTEIRETDDANLTPKERKAMLEAWSKARRDPNGAIGIIKAGYEMHTHGEVSVDLFEGARNAVRTDIGSFLNVRASMLDGTSGIDSLTYTTNEGEKNAFLEVDLPFWIDTIQERLSMPDVTPVPGQRVRFDLYSATRLASHTDPKEITE